MKNKLKFISFLILFGITSKFWIGVYEHDEFFNNVFFIKHRPIWKTFFYSPRGMSDMKLSQMSIDNQVEQKLFDEFVLEHQMLE